MKLNSLIILTAGALTLAGCSTPTKVDSGSIRARTFTFVDPGPRPVPAYADGTQAVHAMIQQAIAKDLTARGVTRVATGADVIVGYLLIIGDNASTTSIDDYFGLRDDAAKLHDKAQNAYTSTRNPNYFKAGTLVIDIIDSKSYKLLRRSYANRSVLQNLSDDARAARIQEVVDEIFRGLHVEQ